jgi:hypothetical protein
MPPKYLGPPIQKPKPKRQPMGSMAAIPKSTTMPASVGKRLSETMASKPAARKGFMSEEDSAARAGRPVQKLPPNRQTLQGELLKQKQALQKQGPQESPGLQEQVRPGAKNISTGTDPNMLNKGMTDRPGGGQKASVGKGSKSTLTQKLAKGKSVGKGAKAPPWLMKQESPKAEKAEKKAGRHNMGEELNETMGKGKPKGMPSVDKRGKKSLRGKKPTFLFGKGQKKKAAC